MVGAKPPIARSAAVRSRTLPDTGRSLSLSPSTCAWADASTPPGARPAAVTGLYAGPIQDLIEELGRLPGIGPKSAQRIAFHLLKVSDREAGRLARAVTELKARITFCTRCFNVAEVRTEGGAECAICTDPRRDNHVLCVVEEARDLVAVERTGEFKGRYHVLGGAINHLEGIGPDQLRVRELLLRLQADPVQELIVCTNPNLEGDATALLSLIHI